MIFDYTNYATSRLTDFLNYYKNRFGNKEPIFVCIGTPNVSGDSIGPYIGSLLQHEGFKVYGTIQEPVTAKKVNSLSRKLWVKNFLNRPIIAIDACIGNSPFGTISITDCATRPGAGCGKQLNNLGNCSIAITTASDTAKLFDVAETEVMYVASNLALAIKRSFRQNETLENVG